MNGRRMSRLLFMAVFLWLSGCRGRNQELPVMTADYSFTDALERQVAGRQPEAAAALMGSFGEIWILAGGRLSGASNDAFETGRLLMTEDIQPLGTFNSPNLEAVLALNPDILLLSSETQAHLGMMAALDGAGIRSAYFSVTYFEDYLHMLDICTDLTGRKDLYEQNGLQIEARINRIREQVKEFDGPRILLMITYSGGGAVQNSDTMTGRMLKELGCHNLADQDDILLKDYNMEAIIAADPDFIFVIPMGNDDEQTMKNLMAATENNPAWNGLSAVSNQRYILLPKELFLYKPNARWGESYEYLYEILYR